MASSQNSPKMAMQLQFEGAACPLLGLHFPWRMNYGLCTMFPNTPRCFHIPLREVAVGHNGFSSSIAPKPPHMTLSERLHT